MSDYSDETTTTMLPSPVAAEPGVYVPVDPQYPDGILPILLIKASGDPFAGLPASEMPAPPPAPRIFVASSDDPTSQTPPVPTDG